MLYHKGIRVLAHVDVVVRTPGRGAAAGDSIYTEPSTEADPFEISLLISNHEIVTLRIKSYHCCKMCSQALLTLVFVCVTQMLATKVADAKITCDNFSRNLDF